MEEKFNICLSLSERKIEESNHPLFLSFIEYVYIEIVYVTEMRETNIEAERKILKKHKKYAKGFVETPKPSH